MSETFYYITFFILTLIVSFYLNGYINKIFVGNKLTDPVNERSSHKYPATRSGGLSVFFTISFNTPKSSITNAISCDKKFIPVNMLLALMIRIAKVSNLSMEWYICNRLK